MENRQFWTSTEPRDILFAALLIVHVVPLWAFEYFPSQDGSTHLYNASIISNYAREGFSVYREFYTLEHRIGVNWLIHLMLAGLLELLPMLIAEKVLLTAYVLLFMLALRYAVLSISPVSLPLAFLGFPLIYNRSMHMGFYSFIFSLAVFLICIGYWVRHNPRISHTREFALLATLSLLLYLTHLLSLLIAIAVIGILTVWLVFIESLEHVAASKRVLALRSHGLWVLFKPKVGSMLAFVPGISLVILFLHDKRPAASVIGDLKIVVRQLLSFDKTEAFVLGGLIAILSLLGVVTIGDRCARVRLHRADGFFLAGLCGVIVYVIAPNVLFGGGLIRERLLIYVLLMLILWVAGQAYGNIFSWLIIGGAAITAIAGLVINVGSYKQFNDYLREHVSAGDFVAPQTTILPVSFAYLARHEADWFTSTAPVPLASASGYVATVKTLVDLSNYEAATDHFPTAFRPNLDPYRYLGNQEDISTLNIAGYYQRVGKHVDYVLVTSRTGVEQDLSRAKNFQRQLTDGYTLIYTSPRDLARLYRRLDYKTAGKVTAPTGALASSSDKARRGD
jgi:hypothetical protein